MSDSKDTKAIDDKQLILLSKPIEYYSFQQDKVVKIYDVDNPSHTQDIITPSVPRELDGSLYYSFNSKPVFSGKYEMGGKYIIIDDTKTDLTPEEYSLFVKQETPFIDSLLESASAHSFALHPCYQPTHYKYTRAYTFTFSTPPFGFLGQRSTLSFTLDRDTITDINKRIQAEINLKRAYNKLFQKNAITSLAGTDLINYLNK